jgi:hypothetical protein
MSNLHRETQLTRRSKEDNRKSRFLIKVKDAIQFYSEKMNKGVELNKKSYDIGRQFSNLGSELGSNIMTDEAKITLMMMIQIYSKIKKLYKQNYVNHETYINISNKLIELFFYYCLTKNTIKIAKRRKIENDYNIRVKDAILKKISY